MFQAGGDTPGVALCLLNLGYVAQAQDDHGRAQTLLVESCQLWQKIGGRHGAALCLVGLAAVAGATGQLVHAVRLYGAAQAQHDNFDAPSGAGRPGAAVGAAVAP
jgi:hypothetical protein